MAEGTFVETAQGLVPIEELAEGSRVAGQNSLGLRDVAQTVMRSRSRYTTEIVHVSVNGETIDCTREHPFWVSGRGWVRAGQLEPGDKLRSSNGNSVIIESVGFETLCEPIRVFSITVNGTHSYYVGESKVLVHNKL